MTGSRPESEDDGVSMPGSLESVSLESVSLESVSLESVSHEPAASELTAARVFLGRSGTSYRTATHLRLRADHAAARDALREEIDLDAAPMSDLVTDLGLIEVTTAASTLEEHLARPDRGRRLSAEAAETLRHSCPTGMDVQFLVGDGLSPRAVRRQVPRLLPALIEGARRRRLTMGPPILLRRCRVGVMNDIGALLDPQVVVLLVGERPGLATAESLSAYFAWRPRPGHTDAERNLISNIHDDGVAPAQAVTRILAMVDELTVRRCSGVAVREPQGSGGPVLESGE